MGLTIEAFEISKRYGRSHAIKDFSLQLERGQIFGLLGPNGSGKTTSLHILTGLIKPDTGSVYISGLPIENKASRNLYGFAPDDLPLPMSLTGREYIDFHSSLRKKTSRKVTDSLIDSFEMKTALDKQVGHYSHGMKRKIQLIAALGHEPDLLVLDEPFRGLDPDAAFALQSIIQAFVSSGRSVLIATHDMIRAQRDCDSVMILNHGAIVAEGRVQDLTGYGPDSKNLEEVFLSVTGLAKRTADRALKIESMFTITKEQQQTGSLL